MNQVTIPLVAVWATVCSANVSAIQITIDTIAITGQQAPQTVDGVAFRDFSAPTYPGEVTNYFVRPSLNAQGQIAFFARLIGEATDETNDRGVYYAGGGGRVEQIARTGVDESRVAGASSFQHFFAPYEAPTLNNMGETLFYAGVNEIDPGGQRPAGIFAGQANGGISTLARFGFHTPSAPTVENIQYVHRARLYDNGTALMLAQFSDSRVQEPYEAGIVSLSPESGAKILVRAGDPVPESITGETVGSLIAVMDPQGAIIMWSSIVNPASGESSETGFFRVENDGELSLIVREGDVVSGLSAGESLGDIWSPNFRHHSPDNLGFIGELNGSEVGLTNDKAIFSVKADGVKLSARAGESVLGPDNDLEVADLYGYDFNDAGVLAASALLLGADDTSQTGLLVKVPDGNHQLVAYAGEVVPGVAEKMYFTGIGSPSINNRGQIAFEGSLSETEGTPILASANGLFVAQPNGDIQLIAYRGGPFEVNGEVRTIDQFSTTLSDFNDLGQLALIIRFTDGTEGIFVANTLAIPEPASVSVIGLTILIFVTRRLRTRS